jgi:internalin A
MRMSLIIPKQNTSWFFKTTFFVLLFTLIVSLKVFSQTYALPDTNLRNKLLSAYPSVMTGNLLSVPAANAYTGGLDLSNANISNASGVEYFIKTISLSLNNNKLTSIPDISGLTSLTIFFANNNQLTSLPAISTLTNIYDFQASNNQLTSLPSFAGLTNLVNIYCQDNKISSISGLNTLTNLQVLDIGNNFFNTLPDLSNLISLKQLHVHQTGIDTIIGLSALTNLEILYAWSNHIRDLSSINANTKLKIFVVGDNELKSLPVLSNKPLLYNVDFTNNYISFEDILPLTSLSTFNTFVYSPQKQFILPSYTLREKDNLTFNLGIDQGISSDWYKWYKNSVLTDSNQTGIKYIPSLTFADAGDYTLKISNPGLPGLVLQTNIGNVTIKPCLEINSLTTNVISESCTEGVNINLSSSLGGGVGPFTYGMVASSKTDTIISSTPDFQGVSAGMYKIIVTDSRMCKASKDIPVKPARDCDPVISPNGDGIMDTYFIQETGKTSIYDIRKNLIKELSAPAVWDGTDSDGSLASDGYYAIVVNGKKIIHITLIK